MLGIVPNDSHRLGLQLELLTNHLRGVFRAWQPSKGQKRRKNNFTQTPLRPPTALYTHFGDPTWITFMFVMVLRTFCAPHIPPEKIFFYDFFLHKKSPLKPSTARNKQNKNMSWMCFLFPLTIPTKWAISEGHSLKKKFTYDTYPITSSCTIP